MRSAVIKHSIVIAGHKTSISLEDVFWNALKEIAASRNLTLSSLVASIDEERRLSNLSSAIRTYIFDTYRLQLATTSRPEGSCAPFGESRVVRSA
ncbi:MAG TPA: ribbon-helix-helix domain-containing protein [Bradyrhizobium sp.]|jgi:predicted DNA-binding ribbon-helix-helix protein|nr:ribbon-helix-helix domain-containing protein [Bradyrhizobium sp.]